MAERAAFRRLQPLEAYRASVHARALANGDGGATCSSCHGAHAILPATDPDSSVARLRVPDTCGQCHGEIAAAFEASIHGLAAAGGISDSPVCTDCHGEHRILSPEEPGSPVFATNDSTTAAVLFMVWSVLVSLSDAVLKPLMLGRGVKVPMLVILLGAIGGMIHSGIIGLFLGAVILALGYKLFQSWMEMPEAPAVETGPGTE